MKKLLLSILGVAALAVTGNAQVLLYDGFNYTAGQDLVGQTNPGNGNAWTQVAAGTSNATIASGGLTYGSLNTTTGRVQLPSFSSNTQDAGLSFTNSTSDIYYSFIFRLDNVNGMGTSFQLVTRTVNSGTNGLGVCVRTNSGNADTFDLGIHKRANTGSAVTDASIQGLSEGTNYFVVVNYSTQGGTNDDIMNIWLNPANLTLGAGSAPAATFSSSTGTDTTVAWNQFQLTTPNQTSGFFDEVRIGTTWASVTPIPEPSTWALLAGSLTSLVVFRRRRA